MTKPSSRGELALAWFCLTLGIAFYVYLMFPGAFFTDAIGLYQQATSWQFVDWHSPVLAAIWSTLDRLVPGFASLLAFGAATTCVGLFLIFQSAGIRPLVSALLASTVPLLPPVFIVAFWLTKDSSAVGALLLGIGALLGGRLTTMRLLIGALILLLSGMIRGDYAPVAAVAFVTIATIRSGALWRLSAELRAPVVLLSIAAFFAGNLALNSVITFRLLDARPVFLLQSILIHDLAALSLSENRLIAPGYLMRQGWDMDYLRKNYSPRSHDNLIWPKNRPAMAFTPDSEDHFEVVQLWAASVIANPRAYLRHRSLLFAAQLGWPGNVVPDAGWMVANSRSVCESTPVLQTMPASLCVFHAPQPLRFLLALDRLLFEAVRILFHPLLYLVVCLAGLAFVAARLFAGDRSPFMLAVGILCGLPIVHLGVLFFFGVSAEYRYLSMLIIGACSAVLVCIFSNLRASRSV